MTASNTSRRRFLIAFTITILLNGFILAYFHNRFWWPADEGAYAHTAERILKGEVLNSDVEEIHTGYLNFIHAAAYAIFGTKLVSLRYPLVLAALLQSCLLFAMFARHNVLIAAVAAVAAISIGVIQYLNPQPSWYCLLFVTLIVYCLTSISYERKWRLEFVGILIGSIFFFRQVTGVFVAMGVLTYLLTERREENQGRDVMLARALLGLMLAGTLVYLNSSTDSVGLLLFGIWPSALLIQALLLTKVSNKKTLEIVKRLFIGCIVSSLPILFYHVVNGSLRTFFDDTVLRALHVSKFAYLKQATYLTLQIHGFRNVLEFPNFTKVVNGLYWLGLPLLAAILGVSTLRALNKKRESSLVGALPIIAVFYGMVALLQQIPIYLFYSLPLSLAGLLWLSLKIRRQWLAIFGVLAILISIVSVYYHAGQPISRLLSGALRGDRIELVPATTLDRTGLWIDKESLRVYTDLVQAIRAESQPDETIFVIPNNPELYFLTDRKNPFRFWNSAIGMRNATETAQVLNQLNREPPRVIVFAPRDRNNTAHSNEIMVHVRERYTLIRHISDFEIYRRQ